MGKFCHFTELSAHDNGRVLSFLLLGYNMIVLLAWFLLWLPAIVLWCIYESPLNKNKSRTLVFNFMIQIRCEECCKSILKGRLKGLLT